MLNTGRQYAVYVHSPGLCDNRKTYISITINNKSYFISINDNVSIMRLCHKMVFQVQIMIIWVSGIYSTATSSVPLNYDDIQQYMDLSLS